MKALTVFLVIFSYLPIYGQDCLTYLDKYSSDFNVQFAYDPDQLSLLDVDDSWEKVYTRKDLRNLFSKANIEIAEIDQDRWLLRKNKNIQEVTNIIRGKVVESSNEPLISALIYTKDGSYAALTDENGSFLLEIPSEKDCEICCQYLGYEVTCVPKNQYLNFELLPKSVMIDNVRVSSKKIQFQIVNIDDSEVLQIRKSAINQAAFGKDVIRTIQLISGVDASNDLSASMVVRASTGMQSLITLDGIPLYNTESSFGMFSVLNPLVVSKASLYKNSMPLEYGEFTGGYLACEGLFDLQEKLRLNVDLNTLFTASSLQIPIGKSTQISGAFRRSNGKISNKQYYSAISERNRRNRDGQFLFQRQEDLATSLENQFGDLYFNLAHEVNENNSISFTLFGNRDISGTNYNGSFEIVRNNPANNLDIEENYAQEKTKSNFGLSFTYDKIYDTGANLKLQFYSSAYSLVDNILFTNTLKRLQNEKKDNYDSQILNDVRDSNLKLQYQTSPKKAFSLKAGLDLRSIQTDFSFTANTVSPFRQDLRVPILTPYWGITYNYKEIFRFKLGMRSAIIPADKIASFTSPRSNATLKLNKFLSLKTSASINQQFFRPIELERQLGQSTSANVISTGRNIPVLRSAQGTLGLQIKNNGFKLNGDLFLRRNTGILEQVLSVPGLNDVENEVFGNNNYELFQGTNNVAGLDLTSSFEKENFYGLISYTYTKSEDRFPRLFQNQAIVDQNNRLNQVNIFASYSFGSWSFSSTYVYGSGIYTLDRLALEGNIDRGSVQPSDLFTQLPDYNRWDISTTYKIPTKVGNVHFDLGIINLLDYQNINSEISIYSIQDTNQTSLAAAQVELLGRVWTLGVRFEM